MGVVDPHQAYRYSYSGTDTRAFAYFPSVPSRIVEIESMHTISVSVHEAKGQARALGYRGVRGLAQSVRTIAGSMILTVIEDHPLAALMDLFSELTYSEEGVLKSQLPENLGWSLDWDSVGVGSGPNYYDFNRRIAALLPPFNIVLRYVAEGSQWNIKDVGDAHLIQGAAAAILNVHLIDVGAVTSVQDIATEETYSFIALDYKPLAKQIIRLPKVVSPTPIQINTITSQYELRNRLIPPFTSDL